ncbi:cadherin [Cryomorpha ignava]|uniref:Cadherin n=1 Tax=Cryomorpha ignava TaxID=101383 RepID=A0A7K3WTF8_9FLAO|nr:PQQ-dependent sugar dehydrogenase [Cryomorpha ignava]NEN24162.1 cadherin [Cryomorpha ignava]
MKKMLILLGFLPSLAFGQYDIDLELLAGGYNQPTEIVNSGDSRLFVVEKSGKIKILYTDGVQESTPFLDITSNVNSGGEKGLLGLAFAPDYSTSGKFYVNYTFTANDSLFTRISRFSVDLDNENLANADSEESLLEFYQPFGNHNGGQVEFGPDGYLYIATGDGGSGGDPFNNGQNKMTFLGKLLRINVSTTPYSIPSDNPFVNDDFGLNEIWAYGLRNPWKFAFDAETGDLYIGDVGQSAIEEVDFQPAGAPGGANYGWRCYEGTQPYQSPQCNDSIVVTDPVFEYSHSDGCSITGGRVYRGNAFPNLVGKYILTDFCSGNYWLLWQEDGVWQSFEGGLLSTQIVAFGEDMWGEMYAVKTSNGTIHKVIDASAEIEIDASVTWLSACANRAAVVNFYQPATTLLAYQYDAIIDSLGQFQIIGAPLGVFDVFLKVNGYLTKTLGIQTVTANTEFSFLAIIPGDLNGDNLININDLSLINLSFAKTSEDEDYNLLADLNCDGSVNILDISLFGASFGVAGDNPPLD